MKHHLNRSLIYLAVTDLIWYLTLAFLFFSSFYGPILDVLEQAFQAIAENTQTLSQTADPLTSQISLLPHVQVLINFFLLFTALATMLGIIAELVKTKIIYKKTFWLKTIALQIGQVILFILLVAITQYILYIQFAVPIIPLWLMIVLISAIWAFFFWFVAQSKARIYAKKSFKTNALWMSYALVGIIVLLASFQIIELVILGAIIWIIGWNWLQLYIASFK